MRFSTRAIHAGQPPDPATGAVMPPDLPDLDVRAGGSGEHKGFEYSRPHNPTRFALEQPGGAREAAARPGFACGLAATNAVLQLLSAGRPRGVATTSTAAPTAVREGAGASGSTSRTVDMTRPDRVREAHRARTRGCCSVETPTNPLLKLVDIAAVAALAHGAGALALVDNTFMTPVLPAPARAGRRPGRALGHQVPERPQRHGRRGARDERRGALPSGSGSSRTRWARCPARWTASWCCAAPRRWRCAWSGTQSNARAVARFLEAHPRSRGVSTRGFPRTRSTSWRARQMRGLGGMVSFRLTGGLVAARRALTRTRMFTLAESLGGVESLIEHPALMTAASVPRRSWIVSV